MFQNKVIGIGEWLLFFILMAIPIVNVVVYILLLINPKTNRSLKNLLLLWLIFIAIGVIGFVALFGQLMAQFS